MAETRSGYSVGRRWTPLLGQKFCQVSSAFLELYSELRPLDGARAINSTEAMLIIHLMDFKWDERAPFPSVGTLATRMGLTPRAVRAALRNLETSGYITREPHPSGGPNRYHFQGLFAALERALERKSKGKSKEEPNGEAA